MKRNAVLIVLALFSIVVLLTGCDRIKQMLGFTAAAPVESGPAGSVPGAPPGPGPSTAGPGIYGQRQIDCCTIADFKAGIINEDTNGNIAVKETFDVPYVPSTYIGIYFSYKSKTGKPIQYREEEYFPYPPQNWSLWEGSNGSYITFPEENKAVYTTILSPANNIFTSTWGFNSSGDPTGQWRWDIYFDNEYYTSVVFNVVPATY
jgi:hypothetical protein